MSVSANYRDGILAIARRDGRYVPEAYLFVHEALCYTAEGLMRTEKRRDPHLSPQELLVGFKEYALRQYGPLAYDVLTEWGILSTEDVGRIVFSMIQHKLLSATEKDRLEDFIGVYDFDQEFNAIFQPRARPSEVSVIV